MGQQASRQSCCACGCGAWERRAQSSDALEASAPPPAAAPPAAPATSVHRYVNAVTGRGGGGDGGAECSCRRRRWPLLQRRPRQPCVCTSYRSVSDGGAEAVAAGPGCGAGAACSEGAGCAAGETAPDECRAARVGVIPHCSTCGDDQLTAVLSLGRRELQREQLALVAISSPAPSSPGEVEVAETAASLAPPVETGEVLVWTVGPHGYPDLTTLDPEDLEEQARVRRALEIAQGVEPPPGYRPHVQVVCNGELRALLLRTPPTMPLPPIPVTRVHTQVDYIHCLVPDLKEITACCFYWGKMDRYEAESLLDNKPEGTFLLRDSAQEEHLFSVSFRKYGRSLHARIEHFNHKFSFDSHDPAVFSADTVTTLIHHYKDPACVMFFEPMLTSPLPRSQPFSLQQLARAVIVSSTTYDGVEVLPLPSRLRAYLKEYHYRQRVRVRRLDSLAWMHAQGDFYSDMPTRLVIRRQ